MIRRTAACLALAAVLATTPAFSLDAVLSNLQGGKEPVSFANAPATVVVFISTKCPISNRYSQRMIDLYKTYSARGVRFVFVNSNENEPPAEVEQHARESRYPFPVYKDDNNVLADKLDAQYTPVAYVFNRAGNRQYQGRIDDSQNPARVKEESLRLAIDAVVAGRTPDPSTTRSLGCTIKRVNPT